MCALAIRSRDWHHVSTRSADHRLEYCTSISQRADKRVKTPAAYPANLEAKAAPDTSNAELDIEQLACRSLHR